MSIEDTDRKGDNVSKPPTPKYKLTVVIQANSHDEIEDELLHFLNGGYVDFTEGYSRDTFRMIGGKLDCQLEHVNPQMTPDKYEVDLREWVREG